MATTTNTTNTTNGWTGALPRRLDYDDEGATATTARRGWHTYGHNNDNDEGGRDDMHGQELQHNIVEGGTDAGARLQPGDDNGDDDETRAGPLHRYLLDIICTCTYFF